MEQRDEGTLGVRVFRCGGSVRYRIRTVSQKTVQYRFVTASQLALFPQRFDP